MNPAEPACPVCRCGQVGFFLNVDGRDYWRCHRCKATFVDPGQLPDRDAEKAEYDRHCNSVHDAGYRAFLARLADPLIERLAPDSRGLDYGCGPGPALAGMLTEAGHPMATWDPIYAANPSVLHDQQYDFITCTEVVEHMHRPAGEFERIDTLLRPGGIFGLMTAFQTDDARFANWHYRRDPTHVVFYREATIHFIAEHLNWDCEIPAANIALMRKPKAHPSR
ncbi:MAG: class I SAM-dependent methyltransferase [Wenzhouxiangellaceae bacterium]